MEENKPKRGRPKKISLSETMSIPKISKLVDELGIEIPENESAEHKRVREVYHGYAKQQPKNWERDREVLLKKLKEIGG